MLCLQEIKALPEQLDDGLLNSHGYHVSWAPAEKKGYSGVATFSKEPPDAVQVGLGEPRFDREGRVLISEYGPLTVVNCYFPNGQRDHARLPYKTDFYRHLLEWSRAQRDAGRLMVICGDWNTAHQELDLKNWKTNRKTSGFTDFERSLIDEFIDEGWHDSFRALHPDSRDVYSWWSNRAGVRDRNIGWRIDYHFVCNALRPHVRAADVRMEIMGSDHCPVTLQLEL